MTVGDGLASVKITPEMIEAGVDILMEFDYGWSSPREYAARIFTAMASAAPTYTPLSAAATQSANSKILRRIGRSDKERPALIDRHINSGTDTDG